MTRTATFDRIGRMANPPALDLTGADDAQAAAERIYHYARKYLMSREVNVVVDRGHVQVYAGFQNGGTGRVQPPYEED